MNEHNQSIRDQWRALVLSLFTLALGGAAYALAGPLWDNRVAPWIASVVLNAFASGRRVIPRFLALWICLTGVWFVANRDFLPLPFAAGLITSALFVAYSLLAYLAHRLVAPRLSGFAATLVLPSAAVVLDSLMAHQFTGTLFSQAYSQTSALPLVQIASVGGIWPITFLIAWFGSTVTWSWKNRSQPLHAVAGIAAFMTGLGAVLAFGAFRLLHKAPGPTVIIASLASDSIPVGVAAYKAETGRILEVSSDVSESSPQVLAMQQSLNRFLMNPNQARFAPVRDATLQLQGSLISATREQADRGAKVVAWSEAAALVLKQDEPAFLSQLSQVAASKKIYLFAAMAALRPGSGAFTRTGGTIENKIVIFGPSGNVIATYLKYRLPPGDPSIAGNGMIPVVSTEYGKLAAAICFDLDSPNYIRQVGQAGAEILIAPSGDWSAIGRHHANAARVRAIENGVALVRPVSHGLILTSDRFGRTVVSKNAGAGITSVATAVPMGHSVTPTIYASSGDVWVTGCLLLFLLLLLVAVLQARARSKATRPGDPSQGGPAGDGPAGRFDPSAINLARRDTPISSRTLKSYCGPSDCRMGTY